MGYLTYETIDWELIGRADKWLDDEVSAIYKAHPLGQDWSRVCKIAEELGEMIAELILYTGNNPRKVLSAEEKEKAFIRMLEEGADIAVTAMLAIQHFTKSIYTTEEYVDGALKKLLKRVPDTRLQNVRPE